MTIAYVFKTSMASTFQLSTMILPQLEENNHGVKVAGMFFFDDNILCLQKNNPVGERLSKVAIENNILLMVCDQCAVRRKSERAGNVVAVKLRLRFSRWRSCWLLSTIIRGTRLYYRSGYNFIINIKRCN